MFLRGSVHRLLQILLAGMTVCLALNAQTVDVLLSKVKSQDLTERIEKFSERFIGSTYAVSPLGEGDTGRYDKGPLYRTDSFDCTTFVETVMALALSRSVPQFEATLKHIRYKNGRVSFTNRNHFPDADWMTNNSASGFVTDITEKLAGPLGVQTATAEIDRKGWYENLPASVIRVPGANAEELLSDLHAEGAKFQKETVSIPYIAFDRLITRKEVPIAEQQRRKLEEKELVDRRQPNSTDETHTALVDLRLKYVVQESEVDARFLEEIPSGTILNVVRPNWKIPGTHLNVTHQGFVIRKQGVPYFRHVSKTGGERLKDVLLANYLKLCLLSPPIKGINILQVLKGQ